ncbi:MAG: hypothetical protein U0531_14380 [Dehalococcoidia bacterium]
MSERTGAVMEAMLALHRERDQQRLLRSLLETLTPEYGKAVACYYLLEPGGAFRLETGDGNAGDTMRSLWRVDLRVPLTLPRAALATALSQLVDTGDPVHVSDKLPKFLVEAWGAEVSEGLQRALAMRYCAVAPINGPLGPLGVVLLVVQDPWPIDVAAECTAHTALALANLVERIGVIESADQDPETGLYGVHFIEQVAAREIHRADRYRRVLSVTVVEPPVDDLSLERLKATADHLVRVMRGPDTAARLGPRRLVVLLPETPPGGAAAFIRRLHENAPEMVAGLRASASTFPNDGRSWDELVRIAALRLDEPEAPPVTALPRAALQGSLRAAFPSLGAAPGLRFRR